MADTPRPDHQQADPFGERARPAFGRTFDVLGERFEFHADDEALLAVVDAAYAGLPPQRHSPDPSFEVRLQLTGGAGFGDRAEPPEARMRGGVGLFGAMMDADNFALAMPAQRSGLVAVSPALLQRFPYHARYELLEFAVFMLASRARPLVPLHAGCIAIDGAGVLLVGESGAGKSTLALHGLLQGGRLVTEDAAFVDADDLMAMGVPNFLHLREDALPWIADDAMSAWVRRSPVIRRRSGVEKFELDLRQAVDLVATAPAPLRAVVFISKETPTRPHPALTRLEPDRIAARLVASQPYAAHQPGWSAFETRLATLQAFELKRGLHPREAAAALREAIGESSTTGRDHAEL